MLPLLLLAVACARAYPADYSEENLPFKYVNKNRNVRVIGVPELPRGCMYEGRWFTEGSVVTTREACLRCACARGALACRRRACAALPDPPPRRCHVLHKKGSCCPELHCPDGVKVMEHGASARFESDDYSDIATPASIAHACVEGGTVYSAGSAMGSSVACEQCFCLGGARRCVRPRCLPPPPGCRARPAPGACCPQRYYCDHVSTKPPDHKHIHDCLVNGERISEGERVVAAESKSNCTQCFCLRGSVRCQPLACAPPLLGCTPLLRPGECCPHQYHCDHKFGQVTPHFFPMSENSLISTRYDDRSFHTDKIVEPESTTKIMSTSFSTVKNTPSVPATKTEPLTTTKVKRKTNDPPPFSSTKNPETNATTTTMLTTKTLPVTTTTIVATSTTEITPTTEEVVVSSTDQPDGTVKIVINGTINCTAELSSTTVPLNATLNDTEIIKAEGHMRTPINKMDIEAMTEYPNDIITDRNVNGGFDENETFTINVTSSLRTNNSLSTSRPYLTTASKVSVTAGLAEMMNSSKKTKGDYDYDYTEPTLPPSLPNLKIIPFVAADAVVDDDISSKETLTYPMLEREDKFPVYYPVVNTKETPYATRREDVYPPTQYPVFVSEKAEPLQYHTLTEDVELPNVPFHGIGNDLSVPEHDYTISTSIGASIPEISKAVTKIPSTSSTFSIETPSVNLFSPPIETEGGFIPKGPGIIDEYYAVYPSTPSAPNVPHLTTSMQLDITKGECISGDGRHVLEGDSISLACSICTCAWSELHCSPRSCHTPPGCSWRPATSSSVDLCCGELVCEQDSKTTAKPNFLIDIKKNNKTKGLINNETAITHDVKPSISKGVVANNTKLMNSTNEVKVDKSDNITSNDSSIVMETTSVSTETESRNYTDIMTDKTYTLPPVVDTTKIEPVNIKNNDTKIQTHDYDEEEEDEGFSFGSVLKLLLSDNYETTTNAPYKKKSTTYISKPPATYQTTTIPPTTTRRLPPKPPVLPFLPMPHHPYVPPKKSYNQNTVNRIDHLVLGEATAIKRTTSRPSTTPFRPISSFKPATTRLTTTQKPHTTTRYTEPTKKVEESSSHTPIMHEGPRPPSSSALPLPGILKLAGCNIYGRMYRVGRIITELSTPCQECWCTELGVQCNSLNC